MDFVKDLLGAISPNIWPVWMSAVGEKIVAAELTERKMITLARRSILHAHAVNEGFFATRVRPSSSAVLKECLTAIEDVSCVSDFPSGEIRKKVNSIMPDEDSSDDVVPGWGAFLDAVQGFLRYPKDRNMESLFWATAEAYRSVSSRACAEFHGVQGNCCFMDDEKETEANNSLCAREIDYQLAQLSLMK